MGRRSAVPWGEPSGGHACTARAARAAAALAGRDHVLPDDVQTMAVPVLAHRLLLTPDAALARRSAEHVVTDLLSTVPVPRGR